MKTAKRALFLALVDVFIVALLVYGFEFLFNPFNGLPVNEIIGGKRFTWGHVVENNRYGFRERDFKTPKPSGTYRIIVLGDSLTWGAGLDVEARYTAIAERLLRQTFPEKQFEVLNFGIPAAPTTYENVILQKFKRETDPDLIVVGFCLNDPQPRSQDYSIEREKLINSPIGRAIRQISQSLISLGLRYIAKLVNDGFYRIAERLGFIPHWRVALGRVYDRSSNEWREFVQALKDIKNTSDELNLPPPIFAVLNQGLSTNYRTSSDKTLQLFSQWYDQAKKTAADIGFISYDHEFEIARQLQNESLVINKLDNHPSASLNRIYGEKLYQQIAKQLTQRQID